MKFLPLSSISILLLSILLFILSTFTTSQQYSIITADITAQWLDTISPLTPLDFTDLPTPQMRFNFMGGEYDFMLHDFGSVHFGDRYSLAENGCCNGSCTTQCDLANQQDRVSNRAVYPLAFESWPTGSFTHAVFSNSTTFVYRTVFNTGTASYAYSVILLAPSTIIIGIDPNSASSTVFSKAFSGIIASHDSFLGPSPINNPANDGGVNFPPAQTYPSKTLISYDRSEYRFGRAYIFCAMGGNLCPPAYTDTNTVPLDIHITTNSDNACYRNLNSGFLLGLLPKPTVTIKRYPPMMCEFNTISSTGTVLRNFIVDAIYDTPSDTFLCTIPASYTDPISGTTSAVDLTTAYALRIVTVTPRASYPNIAPLVPLQAKMVWTPISYKQDWPMTSNYNLPSVQPPIVADTTILGFPPQQFPFPITLAKQCHCKAIRYRGTAAANPYAQKPYQFGRAVAYMAPTVTNNDGTHEVRLDPTYYTTISDHFMNNDDFCYIDCNFVDHGNGRYNNCGQCVTPDINNPNENYNQTMNCWNMCDDLNMKNTGHFNYLMNLPEKARQNGVTEPHSPYHDSKFVVISDTPLENEPVECAVQSQVVPMIVLDPEVSHGEVLMQTRLDTLSSSSTSKTKSTNSQQPQQQSQTTTTFNSGNYYTSNNFKNYNEQHEHAKQRYFPNQSKSFFSLLSAQLSSITWSSVHQFLTEPNPYLTSVSNRQQLSTQSATTQHFSTLAAYPSGTVTGFTTEREHLSSPLCMLDGFKYFVVALSAIGLGFVVYILLQVRAREKRRQQRRDQRKKAQSGGSGGSGGATSRRSGRSASSTGRDRDGSRAGSSTAAGTAGVGLTTPNQTDSADPEPAAPIGPTITTNNEDQIMMEQEPPGMNRGDRERRQERPNATNGRRSGRSEGVEGAAAARSGSSRHEGSRQPTRRSTAQGGAGGGADRQSGEQRRRARRT